MLCHTNTDFDIKFGNTIEIEIYKLQYSTPRLKIIKSILLPIEIKQYLD